MKKKTTVVVFKVEKELLEKARNILKEKELSLPGFLRLQIKELLKNYNPKELNEFRKKQENSKKDKVIVTLRIDRELIQNARAILEKQELTAPRFLRLKLRELISEHGEGKCQNQNT